MKLLKSHGRAASTASENGSVLIIVLWVALGLVALTVYFAGSTSQELRAAENRVAAISAEQAIEGGRRYVEQVLTLLATNGTVPQVTDYYSEAVPVGDARFWLIGRAVTYQVQNDQVFFGLVDEGARVNLNTASYETLLMLTNMTEQLAANIYDWKNTNGNVSQMGDGPTIYAQMQPPYMVKNAPFETVDELKLVYPVDLSLLYGEDVNRNGALDPHEMDTNRNNWVDPGLFDYVTVYTKEANKAPDGSTPINVSNLTSAQQGLQALLQTNLTSQRYNEVMGRLGLTQSGGQQPGGGGGGGGGGAGGGRPTGGQGGGPGGQGGAPGGGGTATTTIRSPLQFLTLSGLTADEFAIIGPYITVTNASTISGRININTAPLPVLACLPGMTPDAAAQLVNFRQQSPDRLLSIAWITEALGSDNSTVLSALAAQDCITTYSYQFTADIAAVGPHGRGYKRVRFVFDTSSGTPRVVHRQDLSHLGWALGRYAREAWGPARNHPETASSGRRRV